MYRKGEEIIDEFYVYDDSGNPVTGLTDADFTKELTRDMSATTETITVTEKGGGYYFVSFIPANTGTYILKITHTTYNTVGWVGRYLVREQSIDTVNENLLRVLGLTFENIYIDNQTYSNGRLTSARIRIYSNSASVGTDNDVIATYNVTATYDSNNHLSSYKVVKV